MRIKKRRRASTNPLERANRKSDEAFIADYLQSGPNKAPSPWTSQWAHPRTGAGYYISLSRSSRTAEKDLDSCFRLIEETSRPDYEKSSMKWQPDKKLREMRSVDLRYIIVRDRAGSVQGFTSLMPTFEEGQPVVYCYEIHLMPELRGTGIAALLMSFLETVAANLPPIQKIMLTCFLSNKRALGFYNRLGFGIDEISPKERNLRSGRTFMPDYVIMSKTVRRRSDDSCEMQPEGSRFGQSDEGGLKLAGAAREGSGLSSQVQEA
ncbi:N-alpha-acetyltransferase 40 [Pleurostoma richardsiae]|uniref:N-alpha-acetyltransferase 40 n=1 Tax=Pleurostoma richardsiae TaxID=41990 RepID=A0AA38RLL7_9PEZI|nr:N-alpha-acetyltransferase 40 [Pleurostoma richardsiae]